MLPSHLKLLNSLNRRTKTAASFNMTPIIDIVFLLIIFFLVVCRFIEAENFPVVLLEAMSAGLAVITSTAGGCPEVVGDTALLVEPRSSDAIREQLEKLISSEELRNHLSRAALTRVRNFAWPTVAQAYLDCYHNVL